MRTSVILGFVAALALAPSAFAADVIIRDRAPDVTVAPPGPGVTVEERAPAPSMRDEDEETTGAGPSDDNCRRTTVHKENPDGTTTTIRKKECD